MVLLGAVICGVNALSILHEAANEGRAVIRWQPWATEYSSLVGMVAALPVAIAAERFARSGAAAALRVTMLIAACALFSLVHVLTMVALRELVWWSLGRSYDFPFGREWLYEFRKDAISYVLALAFLTFARLLFERRGGRRRDAGVDSASVSLSDGRGEVQVDPDRLRAVRGAGNYVELVFADGPARLLRTTLEAAEAALAGRGFCRTHKSWLVRLACVERLERTSAGDFRLHLDGALHVPLSRRNRAALERVRSRLR